MRLQPYNPEWLAALAASQHADKPWLADAFARCTTVVKCNRYIIHFVDPTNANKPGAEWQFYTNRWMKGARRMKQAKQQWREVLELESMYPSYDGPMKEARRKLRLHGGAE